MSRTALLVPCAFVILVLAGCQSEEEKRAEREKLKSELRSEILNDLQSQVPGIVASEFQRALDDHKRRLVQEKAAADAAKLAPKGPAPKAPTKKH